MVIQVILPIPIRQIFKYIMPCSIMPIVGGRVIVPFRSKSLIGIIFSFYPVLNIKKLNFKHIVSIIDTQSIYNDSLFNLLKWFTNYCYCPIGTIFFAVLPKLLRKNHIFDTKNICTTTVIPKQTVNSSRIQNEKEKQIKIPVSQNQHINILHFSSIRLKNKKNSNKNDFVSRKKFFLNEKILLSINKILIKNCFSSWLLTNVHFYKKIKFYLGLIKNVLDKNLQILILAPNVRYIHRMKNFLNIYFNVSIKVIYSEMNDIERADSWMTIKKGIIKIIIGTKMSIFFPFLKLGLIIVYEENSDNYNHFMSCKFNIRDVSIFRAFQENIPIILDSDTPSLKTLYNVQLKKCFHVNFFEKKSTKIIRNKIINLNNEKIITGLSFSLIQEIHKKIKKNKQVLLIFNKFNIIFLGLICDNCGVIVKCHICNNDYEYNKYYNMLVCKLCLTKISKPFFCSSCGFLSLKIFDFGIKKIKNVLNNIFPHVPVIFLLHAKKRFNKDKKTNFFKTYNAKSCIIITVENLVKNYFFPYVDLIALLSIDYYVFSFHFRAIEKFFQFYFSLFKVTRYSSDSLKILIQTSFSKNVDLIKLCRYGYYPVMNNILNYRKVHLLPPFIFQTIIYTQGTSIKNNFLFLYYFLNILRKISQEDGISVFFFGPHPCFFLTNKKYFYHKLLVQCFSRKYLNNLFKKSITIINCFSISRNVKWFLDVEFN